MRKSKSNTEFVSRIKRKVRESLEAKLAFGESLIARTRHNGLTPFPGQIMRVYEVVEGGTKRVVFADATGFGKTYVTAMILGLLNERKGRKHKTLLIAPGQSIETAWTETEINNYLSGLNIKTEPLKITEMNQDNLDGILRGNDIIAVNYHKFDCGTCDRYVDSVLEIAHKVDTIVLEECQNNKGFGKRGKNIKRLIDKTRNKRVLQLSATPGHNGLEDLGVPLHVLDKIFPFAEYDYNSDPCAIKDMILSGQWFNSDRKVVAELFGLPKLTLKRPVYCDIGEYSRNYLEVWKNGDLNIGTKIYLLRRFSLFGKIKSKEGRKCLFELLESFPKDHALVTFTHLKTGVSEELFEFLETFYGKGKVARINGDVKKVRERVEISRRFTDGEYRAISLSFLTMGEGAPCTTGDRYAKVLFFEMPYNHGQGIQGVGRVYRPGQGGKVDVYYIIGKNDWLSSEMVKLVESGELERRYGVRFSREWRPSTICLDIYDIMNGKNRIDENRVQKGFTLNDFQQAVMRYNEENPRSKREAERKGILRSIPKKIRKSEKNPGEETESPMSFFTRTNPDLYGVGEKELQKASEGKGRQKNRSELMVKAYIDERIFDTTAGDTSRLIKQVVEGLEEKGARFNELLDAGCGTGVVSRVLGRSMTNLDLDERMLYPERFYEGKKFFGLGRRVQGFMTHMPFENKGFDLVTASYSIIYNQQQNNEREIEKILLETNRVLRNRGYFIVSLERTTTEKDFGTIQKAIERYGFNILISDFFQGYEDNRKSDFKGTYLLVARKRRKETDYVGKGFSAYVHSPYTVSRAYRRVTLVDNDYNNPGEKKKEFKKVSSQEFRTKDGVSLNKLFEGVGV